MKRKSFLLFCTIILNFALCSVSTNAQIMVKDIAAGALGSSPGYLTGVNGILFFQAWDITYGNELWKSDGTDAGTVLVKDIRPGSGNSNPSDFTNVNGTLYFIADDGTSGVELWKSDGTDAGTVLVKDIYPGSNGSSPSNLTDVNGTLFFSVYTGGPNGTELWKSDGTLAGTVNIIPGSSCSGPFDFVNVNGTLYFGAYDGVHGTELWKSDGTLTGTAMVKDIFPGSAGSTFTGTYYLTNVNGTLFFNAENGTNGFELWKSDGTDAGTVMVKDIYPGSSGSGPSNITESNGIAYFSADNGSNGKELWKSDGTDPGTVMVKDIYPGSFGSLNDPVTDFTSVNGTLYFSATDGTDGYELWKSDGTNAGTVMVKDIVSGSGSSMSGLYPYYTNVNSILCFNAYGNNGNELWKSDGTAAGTVLVNDINPGNNSCYPSYLTNVNGTLYFSADDGTNGTELWKYDLTAAGINTVAAQHVIAALYPNPTNGKFVIQIQDTKNVSGNLKIEICNMLGVQVYTASFFKQQKSIEIDLSQFQKGIYFAKIIAGEKMSTEKIVIQ